MWPDAAWQAALRDLVVAPVDTDGTVALELAGFLRDADPEQGLGVVDLEGDSVRLAARTVVIPHPVLLEDLEELREFAAELGVEQGAGQLFREVWPRPDERDGAAFEWSAYAGGKFEELRHATARAGSYGYRVRGGYAVCPLIENGVAVEAAYWIGADYPESETRTGGLEWRAAAGAGCRCGRWGRYRPVGGGSDGGFGVRGACGERRGRGGGAVSGDQLRQSGAVLPLGEGAGDADGADVRASRTGGAHGGAAGARGDRARRGPRSGVPGLRAPPTRRRWSVRRQSLGFPAWALVNDPANGTTGAAVVKEMERLTRMVSSKPGHAKDGFDEIGARLDRSVPHFLPTYYEQVARLFLAESRQHAASFFGKARAAEQRGRPRRGRGPAGGGVPGVRRSGRAEREGTARARQGPGGTTVRHGCVRAVQDAVVAALRGRDRSLTRACWRIWGGWRRGRTRPARRGARRRSPRSSLGGHEPRGRELLGSPRCPLWRSWRTRIRRYGSGC